MERYRSVALLVSRLSGGLKTAAVALLLLAHLALTFHWAHHQTHDADGSAHDCAACNFFASSFPAPDAAPVVAPIYYKVVERLENGVLQASRPRPAAHFRSRAPPLASL